MGLTVCNQQGCPELTTAAYCQRHAPKPWAGSTRRARLPRDWNQKRRRILRRDPTCRLQTHCAGAPSTEVDHVQAGDDHRDANLQGVCAECHKAKTQQEAAAARRGVG